MNGQLLFLKTGHFYFGNTGLFCFRVEIANVHLDGTGLLCYSLAVLGTLSTAAL
jgi:hypothetical protein